MVYIFILKLKSNLLRLNYLAIFKHYEKVMNTNVSMYATGLRTLELPSVPVHVLRQLINDSTRLFQKEPSLMTLKGPFVVVGDLHGHLLDLLRIIVSFKPPPETRYLFLGDLVDRGDFSLEVITLIMIMKVLWPENIFLIRGNHEFEEVCSTSGFREDCCRFYPGQYIYEDFLRLFSFIPIAAIFNSILFVHGGIGPSLKSLRQISQMRRPIRDFVDDALVSIMWSDPGENIEEYKASPRGYGYLYGTKALEDFLSACSIDKIVRGHQCVIDGVSDSNKSEVTTVFSASNYCGSIGNKSGVLIFDKDGFYTQRLFEPMPYISRNYCTFIKIVDSVVSSRGRDESGRILMKANYNKKSKSSFALETKKNYNRVSKPKTAKRVKPIIKKLF